MIGDNYLRAPNLRPTHSFDLSDRRRPSTIGEGNDHLTGRTPDVDVSRAVLARRKQDCDTEPLNAQHGRH